MNKEGWGDQKCIFGLQTRLLTGRRRRGRRREEGEEEEGEAQAKVWMLAFGMELVIFIWNSCLIVWLGDCSKPRVVRITS